MAGQLIERLQDGTFRARCPDWPVPHLDGRARAPRSKPYVVDTDRVVAEEPAPTHDHPCPHRQPLQPRWHLAIEVDARPSPQAQVVRVAGHVQSALSAQVHGILQKPLQREEGNLPGLRGDVSCTFRERAAVHPADDPLQPPASDIVVDGLGIDPPGPQPWCIDQEAGRNRVQERFQPWLSLMAHNHENQSFSKSIPMMF